MNVRSILQSVIFGFAAALLLASCQTGPSIVKEKSDVFIKDGVDIPADLTGENSKLKENVILLDARPAFVAAVSPFRQAQTLDWHDFTRRVPPSPNSLEGDLYFHARRLARMGIAPDSKVLVLGRGIDGDGEEGRLAWTLRYLGVIKVGIANLEELRPQMQQADSAPPKEVPIWKPELNELLLETRSEFYERVRAGEKFFILEIGQIPWPSSMKFGAAEKIQIPNVDLLRKSEGKAAELKALIPEAAVGAPIVVVDNTGELAAYATVKLRDLGFNASCACSGWKDLSPEGANQIRKKKTIPPAQ